MQWAEEWSSRVLHLEGEAKKVAGLASEPAVLRLEVEGVQECVQKMEIKLFRVVAMVDEMQQQMGALVAHQRDMEKDQVEALGLFREWQDYAQGLGGRESQSCRPALQGQTSGTSLPWCGGALDDVLNKERVHVRALANENQHLQERNGTLEQENERMRSRLGLLEARLDAVPSLGRGALAMPSLPGLGSGTSRQPPVVLPQAEAGLGGGGGHGSLGDGVRPRQ